MKWLPYPTGYRHFTAHRPLAGGFADQGNGIGIQLHQGCDPVEVWTRKEGASVPPDTRVRMLQVFLGTFQDSAPEGGFGGGPGLSPKSDMMAWVLLR